MSKKNTEFASKLNHHHLFKSNVIWCVKHTFVKSDGNTATDTRMKYQGKKQLKKTEKKDAKHELNFSFN